MNIKNSIFSIYKLGKLFETVNTGLKFNTSYLFAGGGVSELYLRIRGTLIGARLTITEIPYYKSYTDINEVYITTEILNSLTDKNISDYGENGDNCDYHVYYHGDQYDIITYRLIGNITDRDYLKLVNDLSHRMINVINLLGNNIHPSMISLIKKSDKFVLSPSDSVNNVTEDV